jgi:hypothetical protein
MAFLRDACEPKVRSSQLDGMAVDPEEWKAMPVEVEMAYRRGFRHGVAGSIEALRHGSDAAKIEAWLYGPIWAWRFSDPILNEIAPDYREVLP